MKSAFHFDPERAVRLTRFAAICVGCVFGLAAASFGGVALFGQNRARDEEARTKAIETEIVEVKKILEDARSKAAVRVRNQSKAVADFQDSVNEFAKAKGCVVSEFLASTDVQDFLSRFVKQGQTPGWKQIETQVSLYGKGKDVVEVVNQLANQAVPIEFSTIQITREKVATDGAWVKAKLGLRVLVQASGGPA